MTTIRQLLARSVDILSNNPHVDSPLSESEWLISKIVGCSKPELNLLLSNDVNPKTQQQVESLLNRRCTGEPLQYILGDLTFFNSNIRVGPGVFIPRPETERMIEFVLEHYRNKGPVLDLCTGSGAILFSIAEELSPAIIPMIGIDISKDALKWAKSNQEFLDSPHVEFVLGDLFLPLPFIPKNEFEIITANPPYISTKEFSELPISVQDFEPKIALHCHQNGLAVLKRIIGIAKTYLMKKGWLICEIGETQGSAVHDIFEAHKWRNIKVLRDYNHKDRFVIGQH